MSRIRSLIARRREDEQGFTLIELMVVVLIIAILIAIAIPTFLGARQRAQNRAAQSNLRNGLTAAKTVFTDKESYLAPDLPGTIATLTAIEPGLTFQTSVSTKPKQIQVDAVTGQITLNVQSASEDCYWIRDDISTGTDYNTQKSTPCATSPVAGWTSGW